MAKIVKPISLSEEAIKAVNEYKEQYSVKSFSQAVEDMILESKKKKDDTDKIRNIVLEVLKEYKLSSLDNDISATVDKKEYDPVEAALMKAMDKEFNKVFKEGE